MLRNVCETFIIEINYNNTKETELYNMLNQWITNNDFRSITQWVLNVNKSISLLKIYEICLDIFDIKVKGKLTKEFVSATKLDINNNIILLAKIMALFSRKAELKKGKSIYINVEPEDVIIYEPIIGSIEIRHYKILEIACMCGIDDFKHLSLFKLTRNKYNLQEKYKYNWEYHASFSPVWSKRIQEHKGYTDYNKQKVIFKEDPNDDFMQYFYGLYGLEPDEQKIDVQNKSIQSIEKIHDWKWFNEQYKKNGLFEVFEEELEEFDVDGLRY